MEIYKLIKTSLDIAKLRGETISNNIANVNTPKYKRKYVTFEESLNDKSNENKIKIKEDKSTSMRFDGNNVDLESEKVDQAANTLMYNSLISITNIKLAMAKSVISGR
ncbi:flagellar basal body protein [Clostridium sardiniense]|uniref:Flagellar basal body rod protein FlgB n=1 Tax=Clostridium sardiniense TaxID=29369 RepID=A0ABS7KV27_CLOSR|nr:flagellar basal body protein [Clostridium sardiniense]MBY0754666.1 flagellar basal body protein [Clostridium sardiniense]MDQ0460614.1 flagellar basal-body rod protein FlgB [Clostridium sardiniense]